MTKLMAVLSHGGGCDYSIDCGTKVMVQDKESDADFIESAKESEGGEWGVRVEFYKVKEVDVEPKGWKVI